MFRETLSQSLRNHVWSRDKGRCVYCGAGLLEHHIDHVFPHSLGGPDYAGNLVLACPQCNLRKGENLDVMLVTRALLHLMLVEEDLGWIARHGLSSWSAFVTPLALDWPEFGGKLIASSIDEDEDAEEIKPQSMNFRLVRPAPQYERPAVEKLQTARERIKQLLERGTNAKRRRHS